MIKIDDLKEFGLGDFTPKEDGSIAIADVIAAARKQARELAIQDKDLIEPIRETARKEASAIERKRALKSMRDKFGLELTNTQIDEMQVSDALDLIYTATTAKSTGDIAELQAQIIAANKKAAEAEEALHTGTAKIEKQWAQKYAGKELEKQVMAVAAAEKLIIPADKALQIFHLELQNNGYHTILQTDGTLGIFKDEAGTYPVLRTDGTGRASVADLFNQYLDPFKQKNNGSGSGGNGTPTQGAVKRSAHAERMAKTHGHRI